MRSPNEGQHQRAWLIAVVLVLVSGLATGPGATLGAEQGAAQAAEQSVEASAIVTAIEALRADPNLGPERTVKSLRWSGSQAPASTPEMPGRLRWLADLVSWINQSGRYFVWLTVMVAAIALVAWLMQVVTRATVSQQSELFVAPTHVRELDIRPEALPADIGGSARALWDRGEHRTAMALLYRGWLSRLVHVHKVPIKTSSTEGDCLALARVRVTAERVAYAARLVRAWQQTVYGHQAVPTADVHALCDEFGGAA